jgi:hypothetical protein
VNCADPGEIWFPLAMDPSDEPLMNPFEGHRLVQVRLHELLTESDALILSQLSLLVGCEGGSGRDGGRRRDAGRKRDGGDGRQDNVLLLRHCKMLMSVCG